MNSANTVGGGVNDLLQVNGKFLGGCDIVREMYAKGELQKVIDAAFAS